MTVFRLLELAFMLICLIAVVIILYGYLRPSAEARKTKQREKLDKDINDYLNGKRKE